MLAQEFPHLPATSIVCVPREGRTDPRKGKRQLSRARKKHEALQCFMLEGGPAGRICIEAHVITASPSHIQFELARWIDRKAFLKAIGRAVVGFGSIAMFLNPVHATASLLPSCRLHFLSDPAQQLPHHAPDQFKFVVSKFFHARCASFRADNNSTGSFAGAQKLLRDEQMSAVSSAQEWSKQLVQREARGSGSGS